MNLGLEVHSFSPHIDENSPASFVGRPTTSFECSECSNDLRIRMTRTFERDPFHVEQVFARRIFFWNLFGTLLEVASTNLGASTFCAIVSAPTFCSIVDTSTSSIRTPRRTHQCANHSNAGAHSAARRFSLQWTIGKLFKENFFEKTQCPRILRLSQPEHRLLPHFRVAVILRYLN
jgi:hypothetical protein